MYVSNNIDAVVVVFVCHAPNIIFCLSVIVVHLILMINFIQIIFGDYYNAAFCHI